PITTPNIRCKSKKRIFPAHSINCEDGEMDRRLVRFLIGCRQKNPICWSSPTELFLKWASLTRWLAYLTSKLSLSNLPISRNVSGWHKTTKSCNITQQISGTIWGTNLCQRKLNWL